MSIRLRIVNGTHVALCAARAGAEEGDIYLDDAWHEALASKFWRDYEEVDLVDDKRFAIMDTLETDDPWRGWREPTWPSRAIFFRWWRLGCFM